MKLGVIGCGNVGFNMLRALSEKGHDVIGYDISEAAKARILSVLGSAALVRDFESLGSCDILFECVPTDPVSRTGSCDLSILINTIDALAALETGSQYTCKLFVQRSTCPPGTARKLSRALKKTAYAVNPSFIRKKTQWEDSIAPERVAIGGCVSSIELLKEVYKSFRAPFLVSECYEVIELLKYVENLVDAVLISLWNEFLEISDTLEIPRKEFCKLVNSLSDRDKFRSIARVPGQAFGMWCLPKDIAAIVHEFDSSNISVIRAALHTNDFVRQRYGENSHAGSELFCFEDGKLKLTSLGDAYLQGVRAISGT